MSTIRLQSSESILARGSSPIDWCEPNYTMHPSIAEFTNTISNITFILLSPVFIYLYRDYARVVNHGVTIIWILFAIVGISSAYFHATLSLLGQMLDELSILWLLAASFALWTPRRVYPAILKGSRLRYQKVVFILTIIMTFLAWIYPAINAYILVSMGVPAFYLARLEYLKCRDGRVRKTVIRCTIAWVSAMACWICDRLLCQQLISSIGLVYLHALFHVSIAYTSFTLCSLFAYFDAVNEYRRGKEFHGVVMKFWPVTDSPLGLPYVIVKG